MSQQPWNDPSGQQPPGGQQYGAPQYGAPQYGTPQYGGQPQGYPPAPGQWGGPPALSSEDRNWAMFAHLGALIAAFVTGIFAWVPPLIIMVTKGTSSPFVRRQAVESLNFQITVWITSLVGGLVLVLFAIVTLGIGFLVVLPVIFAYFIFYVVVMIIATVRANNGVDYRYPLTLRLVS